MSPAYAVRKWKMNYKKSVPACSLQVHNLPNFKRFWNPLKRLETHYAELYTHNSTSFTDIINFADFSSVGTQSRTYAEINIEWWNSDCTWYGMWANSIAIYKYDAWCQG